MRTALAKSGKKPVLAIDSNEYWSLKQSIQNIQEMEETFGPFWCEEPARRWDYRGLQKVANSVKAAAATGENLTHAAEYTALTANEAVEIV